MTPLTTIQRQRIRGHCPDPLVAELRLKHLFRTADLRPAGLPPAALLIVCHLPDPLPGTLRLDIPLDFLPALWESKLKESLDDLARHAARPWMEVVGANAKAVLFMDRAEWLACLASDWADGQMEARWWRDLLKGAAYTAVQSAWVQSPQVAPAALALLSQRGEAAVFINRLDQSTVSLLLQHIMTAFGLHDLVKALEVETSLLPTPDVPIPWADAVPESREVMSPLRRLLLGVSLSLVRTPTRVRSTSFALQTGRWWWNEIAFSHAQQGEPSAAEVNDRTTLRLADEVASLSPSSALLKTEENATRTDESVSAGDVTEASVSSSVYTEFQTAYGGLFYLLNLGVYLGFYSDYTAPFHHQLRLAIWDFVSLVGAELLGEMPPDPVWTLLAALAGHEASLGTDFEPPDVWRIDPSWLLPFTEQKRCIGSVYGGRLRVQHPAGFTVVDVPLQDDLLTMLEAVRHEYGLEIEWKGVNSLPSAAPSPLYRWLGWLMPYIRARLHRALELEVELDPALLLIRHPAHVYVTPTQVDVIFNLDTHPIEIRLAGLDRNPGWLPAAGRTVQFHFESKGIV